MHCGRGTRNRDRRRRAGLSLVEMLVVLAIVGVSAGVVVLGVGAGGRGAGLESEANRLADRLRLAADETLVTGRAVSLVWDARGYAFTGAGASVEALAGRHDLPAGVRLVGGAHAPSPFPVDPDGGAPLLELGFGRGDEGWRLRFDGLTAETVRLRPGVLPA